MRQRPINLLAIVVALAASLAHAAQDAPEALLQRMGDAVRTLNYTGTLVYAHDGAVETMQLVHRNAADGERARLTTISGSRREVICNRDVVRMYLPEQQVVVVERGVASPALPKVVQSDLRSLRSEYRIADLGLSSEAGRSCRLVGIMPNDALRYGYRLCLDTETALPLRTDLRQVGGKHNLEHVVFTEIAFPTAIADALLEPRSLSKDWKQREKLAAAEAPAELGDWKVAPLPPGFVETAERRGSQLTFSDGLASVTVFIEPVEVGRKGLVGAARMGAMNLFGRVLADHQITVVGEVPARTVRRFAESVVLRTPAPRR